MHDMTGNKDDTLVELTELMMELPGIGPISAARIVTDLLVRKQDVAHALSRSLQKALSQAHRCPICNTLTTLPLCPVCSDSDRDNSLICVVEQPSDMAAVEKSVVYQGSYFVLMGRINPLEETGPEDLGMDRLIERACQSEVREVIIATSYTPEGEITAQMIRSALRKFAPHVRVTRLAKGLPAGVEIEYADLPTIASAMTERR